MVEFNKSKTRTNLARLFAGECQDGARYQFLAKKATMEKQTYIKDTLKMLATNEMAHAKVIYDLILNHAGTSEKNIEITAGFPFPSYELIPGLELCAGAEVSQAENVYPSMARIAEDEGYPDVSKALLMIAEVEKTHSEILSEISKKMKTKKLYKEAKPSVWKCSECGHMTLKKEAWQECPLCKLDQGYVEIHLESLKSC